MALKADPPDVLDSGSYNVSDFGGWGPKVIGLVIGTVIFVPAAIIGLALGRNVAGSIGNVFGVNTGDNDGLAVVEA